MGHGCVCGIWYVSFNRNIVECKWNIMMQNRPITTSFNRNIVECKSIMHVDVFAIAEVLIETLWNVNGNGKGLHCPGRGFNRNIVECKSLKAKLVGMATSEF